MPAAFKSLICRSCFRQWQGLTPFPGTSSHLVPEQQNKQLPSRNYSLAVIDWRNQSRQHQWLHSENRKWLDQLPCNYSFSVVAQIIEFASSRTLGTSPASRYPPASALISARVVSMGCA